MPRTRREFIPLEPGSTYAFKFETEFGQMLVSAVGDLGNVDSAAHPTHPHAIKFEKETSKRGGHFADEKVHISVVGELPPHPASVAGGRIVKRRIPKTIDKAILQKAVTRKLEDTQIASILARVPV
jgi:hypothetical protein